MRPIHYRVERHSSVAPWMRGHGWHWHPRSPPSTTCRTEFLAMATRRPRSKVKGKARTNSHHGRLSFALCLTKSIQKWWFLNSAEQRGSWRAGTSRRPIIKLDGNGLTFEHDFKIGNKGSMMRYSHLSPKLRLTAFSLALPLQVSRT
jgi:hypothetical protein